jgi:hypothetical protein
VRVERTGALTLVPGDDGAWRIAAYDLAVTRSGPGVTDPAATATTAPAGATTTTGEAG